MRLRRDMPTTHRPRRVLALAFALALLISTGALAAGVLKGKTYQGKTASSGRDSEGHTQRFKVAGAISLHVAGSGRTVSVSFPSTVPLLYCFTKEQVQVQSTKPAKLSGSGSFHATVDQRFVAGPGEPAIVQVISGRFSGGTVTGTIHTEAAECSGSTTFSASAR
jgi:hypothetical protein